MLYKGKPDKMQLMSVENEERHGTRGHQTGGQGTGTVINSWREIWRSWSRAVKDEFGLGHAEPELPTTPLGLLLKM